MVRVKHKYHYIYKTTCLVNQKYYIGMHSSSKLDDGYLGSGRRIWLSIRKHGKENHKREILEMLEDRSSLKDRERELVNGEILQDPMCMNLMIGGEGGFISIEQQRSRSVAAGKAFSKKLKEDKDFRKVFMDRAKERMEERHKRGEINYATFTGKKHNDEAKKKIGKANSTKQTGEGNSQFGTCWICHQDIGVKKIKKDDLSNYLNDGWIRGRVL